MVNTREIADDYRLAHWAEIVRERVESGLSVKDFCQSRGFHQNIYFYWQRKLRQAAWAEMGAAGRLPAAAPAGWTVAVPTGREAAEFSRNLTIGIGKCCIFVTPSTDEVLLSKVCRILAALC